MMEEEHKELLVCVKEIYPQAYNVFLFGSRVGGWDRPESDYDVGVFLQTRQKRIEGVFKGEKLNVFLYTGKVPELSVSAEGYTLPRLSLTTGEFTDGRPESVTEYLHWRLKRDKGWAAGRNLEGFEGISKKLITENQG